MTGSIPPNSDIRMNLGAIGTTKQIKATNIPFSEYLNFSTYSYAPSTYNARTKCGQCLAKILSAATKAKLYLSRFSYLSGVYYCHSPCSSSSWLPFLSDTLSTPEL